MTDTSTQTPIAERIQAAIAERDQYACKRLVSEAEKAAHEANEAFNAAREKALDPVLGGDELEAARKAMDDSLFLRDRMTRAAEMLDAKAGEFARENVQREREEKYERGLKLHEAAAARFHSRYRDLANELGSIFEDIANAEDLLRRSGMPPQRSPQYDRTVAAIASAVNLPALSGPTPIWANSRSLGGRKEYHPEQHSEGYPSPSLVAEGGASTPPASFGDPHTSETDKDAA